MHGVIVTIILVAGHIAPKFWNFCEGQKDEIVSNTAVYSVIGNTYGGEDTHFNLPDLRIRVPVGKGTGEGLSNKN